MKSIYYNYFHKEPMNRRVIIALLPCVLASIYFFGWRSIAVILWSNLIGLIAEGFFTFRRKENISESVFINSTIFALIMPSTVPWHVSAIGVLFAVVLSKQVFGGFGKNIFNPAMAGRCFVYICFPVAMTAVWVPASENIVGAFGSWNSSKKPIAISGATPMADLKAGRIALSGLENATKKIPFGPQEGSLTEISRKSFYQAQLTGRLSGTMGATSVIAILAGGIYLFVTKTANRGIIISTVASYAILNQILFSLGVKPVPDALSAVMGGGFLFGAFFMATDPVSAPKTNEAKIIYGIIIGTFTLIIRNFSIFNGGLMFAILIANMFAPIMDYSVREFKVFLSSKKTGGNKNA